MKLPFLLLISVGLGSATSKSGCNNDNCARAVTGIAQCSSTRVAVAKSDCSSFLKKTTTKYTRTTTITGVASTTTPSVKPIPTYAKACLGAVRYSSACSCWGITVVTKTVSNAVSTVIVPKSTPTTEPGTPFKPVIPTTYEGCAINPNLPDEFALLDAGTTLPIVNNNGVASLATKILPILPSYHFSKVAGAPPGIYDIVLVEGGKTLYYAVYASGKVGFTAASSKGQTFIRDSKGDKYVTTVFNIGCDGHVTAGIIKGNEFNFKIVNNNVVVSNVPASAKIRRDIPVPKGFFVYPKKDPKPPTTTLRCPNPAAQAVPKNPPVPAISNGCTAVPNLDFVACCNGHDVCYDTCSSTFEGCNSAFLACNRAQCVRLYAAGTFARWKCDTAAGWYGDGVTGSIGLGLFRDSTERVCDCKCKDPKQTQCNGKCIDLKTDPDNCGECSFKCPTGKCTNGACAFNSCTNLGRCEAFSACGAGGSCVCASISDGSGFCVNGQTPCAGLPGCTTSADCGLGSVCAIGSCCQRNVCVTTDACGGKNAPKQLSTMDGVNGTISSKGVWVDKF